MNEVTFASEQRWTRQLVEALVAVVDSQVPHDERADVYDAFIAQLRSARARALVVRYEMERCCGAVSKSERGVPDGRVCKLRPNHASNFHQGDGGAMWPIDAGHVKREACSSEFNGHRCVLLVNHAGDHIGGGVSWAPEPPRGHICPHCGKYGADPCIDTECQERRRAAHVGELLTSARCSPCPSCSLGVVNALEGGKAMCLDCAGTGYLP